MEDKDFVVAIAAAKAGVFEINNDSSGAQAAIDDAVDEVNRFKANILRLYSQELKESSERLGVEEDASMSLSAIIEGMVSVADKIDPDVDTGQ